MTVSKNWKNSAIEKNKGSISQSKQSKWPEEITTFCSINWIFNINNAIFEGFSLICPESLNFLKRIIIKVFATFSFLHQSLSTPISTKSCFFSCCSLGQVFQFKFLVIRQKVFLLINSFSLNISDFFYVKTAPPPPPLKKFTASFQATPLLFQFPETWLSWLLADC